MVTKYSAGGRELGDLLRTHREAAGLTLIELGERVGQSAPVLNRLELGLRAATSETEVVHYLASCGAPYQDVHELTEFFKDLRAKRGHWLCPSGHWMPDSLRSLIFHETNANRVVSYQPEVIPGLLQTEPYIQALFARKEADPVARQAWVEARMERQRILSRAKPAMFTFFIHERALRLEVGDYRVMAEQMLAMLFLADQQNIGIRIVPAMARETALFGGSFLYFGFARYRPLIYLDGAVTGVFLEDRGYVDRHRSLIRQIANVALSAGQSRELIATLADEYDRSEGTWDDHWQVAKEQL
ncbi:helix-turn-helix domain-containing protein [Actinokineospora sp. HUAS TT18]|uniref:helix-turn-helix domain-containing protein n=1 Tax=Actinokineospora sp. HUAS TT18 TaxID=3447451 RepID=UPI003F527EA0